MTLDIAAIKARAEKTTAGPWKPVAQGGSSTIVAPVLPARNDRRSAVSYGYRDDAGYCIGYPFLYQPEPFKSEEQTRMDFVCFSHADAAFIAHARTDIPALIAALEASEAARVKAQQDAERLLTALEDHRNLLKCYVDEFGDVEISMEGFSMPTNTRAIKAEQERDALRNFVADFADTNIAMLPMPHIKHPADEPDKAVSAAEVWEWQNDARRALESSK